MAKTLKIATIVPAGTNWMKEMKQGADAVKQRTDGRVFHFERARELSSGQNLMVDVLMAQYYARTIFDRDLHDQLLLSVQSKSIDHPEFTLINTVAKQQAAELLAESNEFF